MFINHTSNWRKSCIFIDCFRNIFSLYFSKAFSKKNYYFFINFVCFYIFILLENPKLKSRVIDYTFFQLGITKNLDSNKNNFKIDLKKFIDSPYGAHWETAFKIWQDNKFIGVGVKQFRVKCSDNKYKQIKSKLRSVRCATHPHNTYMEILSETGLIGLCLFILIIFFLIKKLT